MQCFLNNKFITIIMVKNNISKLKLSSIIAVLILSLIFSACSNRQNEQNTTVQKDLAISSEILNANSNEELEIDIEGYVFNPYELKIKTGTTVIWYNRDSAGHTVTSETGSELDSGLFFNGETFSHKFNTPGTYNYFCKPHPQMTGVIIVE